MAKPRKTKKAKPPAFQFYPGDFMTGTMTMSLAEVGGYWRLLCHQWESGSVPADDTTALARAMVCERAEAAAIWPVISSKFLRSTRDGLWRNSRLEVERKKQVAFSKLQSRKGKQGGRPKSRGLTPAKPQPKPGESSSSSIFRSQVQAPPQPPAAAGGKAITRTERAWAEEALSVWRHESGHECPHDPPCGDRYRCVGRVVGEKRVAESEGVTLAFMSVGSAS